MKMRRVLSWGEDQVLTAGWGVVRVEAGGGEMGSGAGMGRRWHWFYSGSRYHVFTNTATRKRAPDIRRM